MSGFFATQQFIQQSTFSGAMPASEDEYNDSRDF
jgi:hypothetical protein